MASHPFMLGVVDYIVISIVLTISSGIGVYFRFSGGRQKTTKEFLMAGRDMSIWPVAFSLMASVMSAIAIIGIPSEMYRFGTHLAFMDLGRVFGTLASGFIFLPVLFNLQVTTSNQYLEKRFGPVLRTIVSVAAMVQLVLYMGVALYAPSLALSTITGLPEWVSVIAVGIICTFYSSIGGFKAVLWTDFFQAFLMFISVVSVIIKGSLMVGGLEEVFSRAKDGDRLQFPGFETDLNLRYTFWNVVVADSLVVAYGFGVSQIQVQRLLAVKSISKSLRSLYVGAFLYVTFHLLCCLSGLVIYAVYYNCDPLQQSGTIVKSADQLLPYFVMQVFSAIPGLSGLCVAGIFSAVLSTMSSVISSMTAITVEDIIKTFFQKNASDRRAACLAKISSVAYGAIGIGLTYLAAKFKGVIQAAASLNTIIQGPLFGVFILGMFTASATERGALLGLLSGLGVTFWICFGALSVAMKSAELPLSTQDCPDSNTTSTLQMYVSSLQNLTTPETTLLQEGDYISTTHSPTNGYLFPLYKISYRWYFPLGMLVTLIIGYLASFIIGPRRKVDHNLLSPVVRWCFKERRQDDNCKPVQSATQDVSAVSTAL